MVIPSCRTAAVLIHYLFLVSFMWMLMEGVVLYIILVKVFVEHKKRYLAVFMITSYGEKEGFDNTRESIIYYIRTFRHSSTLHGSLCTTRLFSVP